MNGGPSGFNNAPVARIVVIASALLTIIFGIRTRNLPWSYQLGGCLAYAGLDVKYITRDAFEWIFCIMLLSVKVPGTSAQDQLYFDTSARTSEDIFKKLQIWKLIVSVFGFSSTPELVFGIYLLYYFRVFERQIGSNKYTVFILFSVTTSLLLEVLAQWLLKDPSLSILTSGPYGLIFSSFIPFYFDIPVSTRFRVSSLSFSDKTFIYLAGAQLFLSSWKRSMLPGICGLLAGSLYRMNVFRVRRMKFPEFIASFFSRLSFPSIGNTSLPARSSSSRTVPGSASPHAGRQVEANYPSAPLSSFTEPPEDSIATLVSMGFDPDSARQALIHARNDVNAATNILLESQAH